MIGRRRPDPYSYGPKYREFQRNPVRPDDVVLLGDSITCMGPWSELFPTLPVRNLGISGDTTSGVLRRLDQVTTGRPAKVFLLIGTNDVVRGVPADQLVANVVALVQRIRSESPTTAIWVQSILPREARYSAAIRRLNVQLQEVLRHQHGVGWIDLWPSFDDGASGLRADCSDDSIHLNALGYQVWAQSITGYVTS